MGSGPTGIARKPVGHRDVYLRCTQNTIIRTEKATRNKAHLLITPTGIVDRRLRDFDQTYVPENIDETIRYHTYIDN